MRNKRFWICPVLMVALGLGPQLAACRGPVVQSARPAPDPAGLRLFLVKVKPSPGGGLMLAAYEKTQLGIGQRFAIVDDGGTRAVVQITGIRYVECSHCANYEAMTRWIRAPSRAVRAVKGEAVAVGPLHAPLGRARVLARDPNAFVKLVCTSGRRRKPILTLDLDGDSKADLRRVAAFCPDVCYEVQARRGAGWRTVQRDCLPVILDAQDRVPPPR